MIIKSTADVSLEQLENIHDSEIDIRDSESSYNGYNKYNHSTFIEIKKAIIKFLENLPKIDENDPNKEKKIFTYIYSKMAHTITYNYRAADATGDNHPMAELLVDEASGLEGALLKHTCICAGYSETLRNLLAECGITSIVVRGGAKTKADEQPGFEGNHAWNQVFLDGKWYHCDITNDADFIKEGLEPLHFLKSDADCTRLTKYPPIEPEKFKKCDESLSKEETDELILGYRDYILEEISPKEKPVSKKPGFIQSILQKLNFLKSNQMGGN